MGIYNYEFVIFFSLRATNRVRQNYFYYGAINIHDVRSVSYLRPARRKNLSRMRQTRV